MKLFPKVRMTIGLILLLSTNLYSQKSEEYELMATVISSTLLNELSIRQDTIYNKKGQIKKIKGFKLSFIYMSDSTQAAPHQRDSDFKFLEKYFTFLTKDIYNDFVQKNKFPIKIDSLRGIKYEIRPIPKNITTQNPIICVSRPGINDMKDKALIYFSLLWGGRVGYGSLYLLQKTASGWVIKESFLDWIT